MSADRGISKSERLYAHLLRIYPAEFRARFGDDMREYFRDLHRVAATRGRRGGTGRLWMRALADLASSAFREHVEAFLHRRRREKSAYQPQRVTRKGDSMLQNLLSDLRFTGRMLRKSPVFTFAAVAVIAIGSGAVSTIFSVANAIVLRPLPGVERASDVVTIERVGADGGGSLSPSYPYYRQVAAQTRTLGSVAAWSMIQLTVSTGGEGVTSLGNIVSGNYFETLGVRPAIGRFFSKEESTVPATFPVVVLSDGFWRRRFGGDSGIVGKRILLNGSPFTVIGIAPPRFAGLFPVLRTDAWVPLMMQRQLRVGGELLENPGAGWLELFGRLKPGATRVAAQQELADITKQITSTPSFGEPKPFKAYSSVRVTTVSGLPGEVTGAVNGFFAVLLAVAGLVLFIASANVASMLLARAISRRREIAVRIALGAGRGRLLRQLLTESLSLFALGGAGGTLLAIWGTRLLERVDLPVDMPLAIDLAPDARVLAFTLIVALVTGAVFGLAPALQASRPDLSRSMRAESSGGGRVRSRTRSLLVIGQVAMSLLLLSAAGLFLRALQRGRQVDPGFDASNVATAYLNVGTAGYDEARARVLYRELASRLATTPGVTAVGYARMLPLSMNNSGEEISVPGYTPSAGIDRDRIPVYVNNVDEGYFLATRIALLSGRLFRAADDERAPRVAVVNQSFAKQFWPGSDAVGHTFRMDTNTVTVVGVVRDSKYIKLNEGPTPFMYLPIAQHWTSDANLLVRTTGDPSALTGEIRQRLASLDPLLPAPTITTLRQSIAVVLLPQRVAASVATVLGMAGLLLATIGLYGVLSFSAAQRAREIGVRLALGARRTDVVRLVVNEGMRLVGYGVAGGLILSFAATRALRPFLFGVSPLDPATFGGIAVILGGAAFLACYLPARRAASVDPAQTLRAE
jgi:predicted permease